MVLSKPDILRHIQEGKIRFDPVVSPDQVAQVSIDLRLGRKFTTFKDPPAFLAAIHVDPSLWDSVDLWNREERDSFLLKPREFVLAQTLERIAMPTDLIGFVEGRSSFARVGITIHITAPKIDPGFDGHITLEMANFGKVPVELRAEIDQPAQLILMTLTTPLAESEVYGTGGKDVFQHQTEPIPSKPKKLTSQTKGDIKTPFCYFHQDLQEEVKKTCTKQRLMRMSTGWKSKGLTY